MVAECNEGNNVVSRPVTLSQHCPRADFFNQFTRPEPYQPNVTRGSRVTVSFSYVNQGGRYEGRPVPVKLYLRPAQGGERLIPVAWHGTLDRRMETGTQKLFRTQRVRIPADLEPGQYQWVAQADEGNEVLRVRREQ